MKRKQFLNRLLKISELHECLNPIQDIALISTKPNHRKQFPEPKITRIIPVDAAQSNWQESGIKSRQIVVIKNELVASKVLIHAKANNTSCRKIPSRRRMKTTPTHSKLNSTNFDQISRLLEDNCRSEYLDSQTQQKQCQNITTQFQCPAPAPHYLEIRELQPQVFPRKVNQNFSRPLKQALHNDIPRYSRMKKHSLTEPTEAINKESITERKIHINCNKIQINIQNDSIRSDSFKKYRSLVEQGATLQKVQHNKIKLSVRKEINKNYTKHFIPPPKLTAKSYIIYEVKEQKHDSKVIVAFNSKNSQQVASLTKIMTCILALEVSHQFNIDKSKQEITIGKMESSVGGTTASLAHGEVYTVHQLLLGLMLPSGNDASMALAIWAGRKLLERELEIKFAPIEEKINTKFTKLECYNRFVALMNTKAKIIGMNKTNYANSHGLMNPNNKSCAFDIAILCDYAMRNEQFRAIVHCRHYKGAVRFSQNYKKTEEKIYKTEKEERPSTDSSQNDQKSPSKQSPVINKGISEKNIGVEWQNTHKLLHLKPKDYLGIKTGYTVAAGPCLSSYLSISSRNFIIIVLGCGRVNLRFKETQILRKWLIKHENLKKKKIKPSDNQPGSEQQDELEEQEVEFLLENMKIDEERED